MISSAHLESTDQQNLVASQTSQEQQEQQEQTTNNETQLQNQTQDQTQTTNDEAMITLTSTNFEKSVQKCFAGHACQLSEDAWRMYQEFKLSRNNRVTDLFISYLRSKLKDPTLRDVYREDLLKMIDEFYPPEEKQFQEASYYSYLGDPQKSLDLYLDLQRQSSLDATLRVAPNENIANELYALQRYSDALIYYKMALNDLQTNKGKVQNQDQQMLAIQQKMTDIKSRLDSQ